MNINPIVVIFSHTERLEWYERISLEQCSKIFGERRVTLVCPDDLDISEHTSCFPSISIQRVNKDRLESLAAYNKFKYSSEFYEIFSDYSHLLTYELDAFVFRDELDEWCEGGWSYIGAPIFEDYYNATDDAAVLVIQNSGFSLRSIPDCLTVLASKRRVFGVLDPVKRWYQNQISWKQAARKTFKNLSTPRRSWNPPPFSDAQSRIAMNEDLFWGKVVPWKFPAFRVADFDAAARFSFDGCPRRLFKHSGDKLPFGCHKWHQTDPDFWRPIIESHGYSWQ